MDMVGCTSMAYPAALPGTFRPASDQARAPQMTEADEYRRKAERYRWIAAGLNDRDPAAISLRERALEYEQRAIELESAAPGTNPRSDTEQPSTQQQQQPQPDDDKE